MRTLTNTLQGGFSEFRDTGLQDVLGQEVVAGVGKGMCNLKPSRHLFYTSYHFIPRIDVK
jgi:hypothetical protein